MKYALALILFFVSATAIADDPSPLDQILSRQPAAAEKVKPGVAPATVPSYDQSLSFKEQNEALKRYCRTSFNDPKCAEFHKELGKGHKQTLSEICNNDPLNERCIKRTQRSIDDVYKVEAYCRQNPKGQGCKTKRKHLLENR